MAIRSIALVVFIGLSIACGGSADPAPTADDLSTHGLSPQVMKGVRLYRDFLTETLAKSMTQSRRELFANGTQRRLTELAAIAKTDADRRVLLVLALMRAKDNERFTLVLQRGAGADVGEREIPALYEAREVCYDELLGWIESIDTDTASLEEGECLAEAIEAAEELGIEPPS